MADLIASIAICIDPSVPFLNPIGAERPEASCLCIWLSVVLAPIAPQLIRSPIYWGVMGSKNSVAAGNPSLETSTSNCLASLNPLSILFDPSRSGSLI